MSGKLNILRIASLRLLVSRSALGIERSSLGANRLVEQREEGIIGFIVKKINGVYHLLIQAKLEAGNFDVLEMAPTVQCITGSYRNPDWAVPYLEYFTGGQSVIFDLIRDNQRKVVDFFTNKIEMSSLRLVMFSLLWWINAISG